MSFLATRVEIGGNKEKSQLEKIKRGKTKKEY